MANDFLTYALAPGANVATQGDYAASTIPSDGVLSGEASSEMFNKSMRQSLYASAAIAALFVARTGRDILDDGVLANFQASMVEAIGAQPLAGYAGLLGSATGANKLASWTIGQIVAGTTAGALTYRGLAVALNFDGATVGANGMDTGAIPAANDLYIYAIYAPATQTWACLGTVGSTAVIYAGGNMPAGYTASCLIWAGKTSGSNIKQFDQLDRQISIAGANATVAEVANPGPVGKSITPIVPPIALSISGYFNIINFTNGDVFIGMNAAMLGKVGISAATGNNGTAAPFSDMRCPGQTFYFQTSGTAQTTIVVSSYRI